MPLTLPQIDDRRYDDLLGEAIARIPVHTPEWTSFNHSDPGVTLIEVFAFLTESLLYRANQIPERNRKRFLQLLRIPLQTATPAKGLITISNQAPTPDPQPVVLTDGVEVRSGQVPFRTTRGLDVLPVEGRFWIKQKVAAPTPELKSYYQQLYASYRGTPAGIEPSLYEAVPFPARGGGSVSLGDTIDGSLWLALLVRDSDVKLAPRIEDVAELIRSRIANRTLSLGVVPSADDNAATLPAGRSFGAASGAGLRVEVPNVPASGGLPEGTADRVPEYRAIGVSAESDLFSVPGIADVTLPDAASLRLWNNIDPLEAGVDGLPPAVEDEAVAARIVTWLRISSPAAAPARFLWMGCNAVPVTQSARIVNELLPDGTGEPEQAVTLSRPPVLPASVTVTVTTLQGQSDVWQEIDDLGVAGAEVPVPDPRLAPGGPRPPNGPSKTSKVFVLNAESGEIRFGDGAHGSRPPAGATLRATYEYSLGAQGNVGAATIDSSPVLPEGFTVTNPVATWGGADAEGVADGEKQIARYLQHRDRLVTVFDFKTITLRTPGVEIGRVEVLPNYNPSFGGAETPGAVTLMVIPTTDPQQPDAPLPRRDFLDTVCRHLDPRRLVTTEVFLRGPDYQGLWISIGIKVAAGFNETQITEAVKQSVLAFLAPTAGGREPLPDDPALLFGAGEVENGWKLGKSVVALEIAAVANRTRGVEFVQGDVLLGDVDGRLAASLDMTGLQLPRVLGIRVTNGPAASLDDLRGKKAGGSTIAPAIVQIPVIPEECR